MGELRFLLDEHLHRAIAPGLQQRGIEAITAADAGLRGAPDVEYLRVDRERGYIVVTFDNDYLSLHDQGTEHIGIVYFSYRSRSIGHVVMSLVLVHEAMTAEDLLQHVEYM